MESVKGSCLCGRVTLTVTGINEHFGACHCDMCKVWTGSPQMGIGCKDVKIDGKAFVSTFDSSAWAERAFCKTCGTHLYYRVKDTNDHRVMVGFFKDAISPKFEYQYFIDKKPDNFSFADETKDLTTEDIMKIFASRK